MCLHKLADKNLPRPRYGYKVMFPVKDGFESMFRGHVKYRVGRWYCAERTDFIIRTLEFSYKPGFHVYTSLKTAKIFNEEAHICNHANTVVVKVEMRGVHTIGCERLFGKYFKTVVCSRMRVIGEV